jgi:preprotein translocase subunit SecD
MLPVVDNEERGRGMLKPLAAIASVFLVSQPVLAETLKVEVEHAEAGLDQATGQPIVSIQLSPKSTTAFAAFTKARVGEQVRVRFGNQVLMEPIVREPIAGGALVMSGNFTEASAGELVDNIKAAGGTLDVEGSDR